MSLIKRLAMACVLAGAVSGVAEAQSQWPDKPIRMVVAYVPGGPTDVFARLMAAELSPRLGYQVYVDNRGGAGATTGTAIVARSAPDGYTLTLANFSGFVVGPRLFPNVGYHPVDDFTHIALLGAPAVALVANGEAAAKTFPEFLAQAKAQPGKIRYASAGAATTAHLVAEFLKFSAGIDVEHIPYKGGGPSINAVATREVDYVFTNPGSVAGFLKDGRMRLLAMSSQNRSLGYPDVPTMGEAGVPGFVATTWFGISGPAGMPRDVVDRLNKEAREILRNPALKARFDELGAEQNDITPEQYTEFVRRDYVRWGEVIPKIGIKAE